MFIPYNVDVPFDNRPVMNWLVFGGVILAFLLQIAAAVVVASDEFTVVEDEAEGQAEEKQAPERGIGRFVLSGWKITGLFGHMWLHQGLFHLIGNLIFLWLFGNAVCSKIGNIMYLPVYVALGLVAAVVHLVFIGGSMIGASGAINGIVGMYLVFFPENSISCLLLLFFHPVTISVSGYWIILLWFVFDIWGAASGGPGVAYFAHIGGFVAGFGLAVLMLKAKWVEMESDEKSLLQMLGFDKKPLEAEIRGDLAPWQRQWGWFEGERAGSEALASQPRKHEEEFIRFICSCGKKIKVQSMYAGKVGRCPKCQKRIKVPAKESSD